MAAVKIHATKKDGYIHHSKRPGFKRKPLSEKQTMVFGYVPFKFTGIVQKEIDKICKKYR